MLDSFIRVGAATPEVKVADTVFNATRIIEAAKKAADQPLGHLALAQQRRLVEHQPGQYVPSLAGRVYKHFWHTRQLRIYRIAAVCRYERFRKRVSPVYIVHDGPATFPQLFGRQDPFRAAN